MNNRLLRTEFRCFGIAPSVINGVESFLKRRSFKVSVNSSLLQMAETASGDPQGSVLGPILFVIYINDSADNLTIDHLLYADDVKLIAPSPRIQVAALQSSSAACSKLSKNRELSFNLAKSERLPVGDTSNPVAYALTSRTSPNAQPIQTVSTV